MSFLNELKRRNVLRVGAAYIVTAWLIVQVVETLFPMYGLSDAAARMVVNVLGIGLVPALVLAWVFEWTPEGLKKDEDVSPGAPASIKAAKRLDRIILLVLALALGYFAFDKFVLAPRQMEVEIAEAREEGRTEALIESYGEASIAVLAFDDMSQDGDQEYLSDGIAEEILHLLEKIDGLRVISRTSAFSYKGKDVPIPTIAEQLDVAHILEGSVRKAGDRIRVTAQLIEARTDTHLWSQTYDRTLDDIFAIQDELAAAMVEQLHIELLGQNPVAKRVDPEAYMLYLEGHSLVAYRDADKAALLLEQAVRIEPGYFEAWVDLSRAYWQMSPTFALRNHEGDENWHKGNAAWDKAVELDPDHPAIVAWDAWEAISEEGDFFKAARLTEQAIGIAPENWEVIRATVFFSGWLRRDDVAVALLRPVVRRDPLCADCSYRYSRAALAAGLYEEAEKEIMRFRALVPGVGGELTLGKARLLKGDVQGAREAFSNFPETQNPEWNADNDARKLYGDLLVRLSIGETEGVEEDIARFKQMEVSSSGYAEYAELHALMGETDQAFDSLRQYMAERELMFMAVMTRSPFLRNLHDDPRWDALLEEIGVAPHQLAEINFDPKLPE